MAHCTAYILTAPNCYRTKSYDLESRLCDPLTIKTCKSIINHFGGNVAKLTVNISDTRYAKYEQDTLTIYAVKNGKHTPIYRNANGVITNDVDALADCNA